MPLVVGPHHRIMESTQSSISRIQPAYGYRLKALGSVDSTDKKSSHQSVPNDTGRSSLKRQNGSSHGNTPRKQETKNGIKRKRSNNSSTGQKS